MTTIGKAALSRIRKGLEARKPLERRDQVRSIKWSPTELEAIEAVRGDVAFGTWVRDAALAVAAATNGKPRKRKRRTPESS